MVKRTVDPVGTLTVGNVVSTSTTLYKSNFKRYFQVSLRAAGWAVAIILSALILGIGAGFVIGLTDLWLVAVPVGFGWIAFSIYCLAKYSTDRAIIARLAYQELINQPETVPEATAQLVPRTWGFLRVSLLTALYIFIVFLVSYILLAIAIGLCVAMVTGLNLIGNPLAILLAALTIIGAIFLFIFNIIRYYSYWFVAELPMAIESTTSAKVCLRRSRELSTGKVGRLQLIIFIAFLITLPISLLGNSPSIAGQIMSNPVLFPDEKTQALGTVLLLAGSLLGIVSELFVMPFWQAITAVIYYDLRNRREGSDLLL